MDIHRQTGSQFYEHMKEAEKILKTRGLKIIDDEGFSMTGPTGCYLSVTKV